MFSFGCYFRIESAHGSFFSTGNLIDIGQSNCSFCHSSTEDAADIFLHCDDVWKLWMKFTKWLDSSWIMPQECTGDRDFPTKSNYFAFAWHFMGHLDIKK
jgi:hypothetical protein